MADQSQDDQDMLEAEKRFQRTLEWESNWRPRYIGDLKFRHADSDNGWQWPDGIRKNREIERKPCLTLNVVRQHNLLISNAQRQNKSSVKVIATGGTATAESAKIVKGLIRYIEYCSDAQSIYTMASNFQIDGGIGWWRILTEYCDNDSFDQCIKLAPVVDPLSVLADPDAEHPLKMDGKFLFNFDMLLKDELYEAYPKLKDLVGDTPMSGGPFAAWVKKDHIWVCEYFRKVPTKDVLYSFIDPQSGERKQLRRSQMPKEVEEEVKAADLTKWRVVWDEKVEWKLIAGRKIVDKTDWPGMYIPFVPVIGEEIVIDGNLDRKGHTRDMKDPQRMYNYNASGQTEFIAVQTKTPWVGPMEAFEGFEDFWDAANVSNRSWLPYNYINEEFPEKPVPPPQRAQPPVGSPGYQEGMETAFNQMMMTSGQYQNQMGMMGNERTGKAIGLRQDQGDLATFHFPDNFASSLRYTGVQFLDLIPKVFDTPRVMKILADDDSQLDVMIDPGAQHAYLEEKNEEGEVIKRVLNPTLGTYGIAASVGPSFESKQKETVEMLTLILTQAPQLTPIIGDLLMKNLEFDEALEAARRLYRGIPKEYLGEGPSQSEQKLQTQVQALQFSLAKALEQQAKTGIKLVGKSQQRDIAAYDAETRRFQALSTMLDQDPEGVKSVIGQLVEEALAIRLSPIVDANRDTIDTETAGTPGSTSGAVPGNSPLPGARLAPDGHHYLPDPTRPGKYLRVRKRAAGGT